MDENPTPEIVSDEFYKNYCTFVEAGVQQTVTLFEDAEVRAQILALRKPMSKAELTVALPHMLPEERARFVRRIDMGYDLAKLTEIPGEITRLVHSAIQRRNPLNFDEQ